MTRRTLVTSTAVLALSLAGQAANATPALRVQVDQKGDFLLVGNTLGYDCAPGTPAPVVGTVGACGLNTTDSSPDVFWASDSPAAGQAQANNAVTNAQARSTAFLNVPAGATVTHAYLYWGATFLNGDSTVTLSRPGAGAFSQDLTASTMYLSANDAYQGVADVTSIVQAQGSGAYRVSGVSAAAIVDLANDNHFAGWWMVVFYALASDPPRNLALFDGLDLVANGVPQNTLLSGFVVPPVFGTAKLGIVTFEGDNAIPGDQFFFNGAQLSNGQNPATNFFNGTRSFLGSALTVAGDLPQLTGAPQSMSGIDMDVVDITSTLSPGQTQAPVQANSSGDVYFLAGFVTSIPTFKPDFNTSTKTVVDVDGAPLLPGDVMEYTIVVTNTGNDASVNTVLTDILPAEVAYVPGTLQISAGANSGAKTDAAGDDQCDFLAAMSTVVCRLGVGATAATGGQLAIGGTTTVKFQVTVKEGVSGTISNQAVINAAGLQGAPPEDTPTDGNGNAAGQPPTDVIADECVTDDDCADPTPYCFDAGSPNECVECLVAAHCPAAQPVCDPGSHECVCVPSGAEICDGADNDCNGTIDDGFDVGAECTAGLGVCQEAGVLVCNPQGAAQCTAQPGEPQTEVCDGLDNDCDGAADDGLDVGEPCSAGVGECAATGTIVCDASGAAVCDATPGEPSEEICGDELDSDCDGDPENGCGTDTDGDGLDDDAEIEIGTDPNDADSDDDGALDGQEKDPGGDADGDGTINGLDPDSDDDGLFDGTELGLDCDGPDTDPAAGNCTPDGDEGATVTDPLDPDTDDGGVLDGNEDLDHDGFIDDGEWDPNDPSDDGPIPCEADADCGGSTSGFVCDDQSKVCIHGCRPDGGGNSCPSGQECKVSSGESIGSCVDNSVGEAAPCACSVPGRDDRSAHALWLLGLAALASARRRRPSRRRP